MVILKGVIFPLIFKSLLKRDSLLEKGKKKKRSAQFSFSPHGPNPKKDVVIRHKTEI